MDLRSLIPIGRARGVARRELADPFAALQRQIDWLFDDFTRGRPAIGNARELTPKNGRDGNG